MKRTDVLWLVCSVTEKAGDHEDNWLEFLTALDDAAAESGLDLQDLVDHIRSTT
jgi:hypothetical protein